MTREQCRYCGEFWSPTSIVTCCDPAAFNPDDPDDNPDIERSADQC